MTPERELRIEIARNIIDECEVLFSAQAWKFYQRSGRGYLYLHKVVNIQHEGGNNFSINESESVIKRVHYAAQGSEAWTMMTLSKAAKEQPLEYAQFYQVIDMYKPKTQYVVVIGFNYGSDATEDWFLRQPEVPPMKAYTMVRCRPQEFGVDSL